MMKCFWARPEKKKGLVLIFQILGCPRLRAAVTGTRVLWVLWPPWSRVVVDLLRLWQSWQVQPDILSEESGLWKHRLTSASSHVALLPFFFSSCVLHSFVLRLPSVVERLGTVFSIPGQLQRVTGCSTSGPTGTGGGRRSRWFGSHVTPSAWQRRWDLLTHHGENTQNSQNSPTGGNRTSL